MNDVIYCSEKLYAGLRVLLHHGCTDREAMWHALYEFDNAFGTHLEAWAIDPVARVREVASFNNAPDRPEGRIRAWVNDATEVQLQQVTDALLSLFEATARESERRAKRSN